MPLPPARWTRESFAAYSAAVPMRLPLPPGEPSDWTCLLRELGPAALHLRDDRGSTELLSSELLEALLKALGRPVSRGEQRWLLLVTPIPKTPTVDEALVQLLTHETYSVRQCAAIWLGRRRAPGALGALRSRQRDSDNDARRGVAEGLGRLGERAAVPDLCRTWGDPDESVDVARVEALVRLDDWANTGALVEREEEHGEPWRLACALRSVALGEAEAEVLTPFLSSSSSALASCTGKFLRTKPELANELVPNLADLVRELSDLTESVGVAQSLGAAGEEGVEELLDLLKSSDWRVRLSAAQGLSAAPRLPGVIDSLRAYLRDDDSDVRREVALSLVVLGETSALQHLELETFSNGGLFVNRLLDYSAAGVEFGMLGQALGLARATPDVCLTMMVEDGDPTTVALGMLVAALAAPELALPTLQRVALGRVGANIVETRRAAAAAVLLSGGVPPMGGVVHRLLLAHEGSISSSGSGVGAEVLPHVGGLAAAAARDPSWEVRLEALRALRTLGQAALPYLDLIALIAVSDEDADCRRMAAEFSEPHWVSLGEAEALSLVLAPNPVDTGGSQALGLQKLLALKSNLAAPVARRVLEKTNARGVIRAAARAVGASATPETARGLVAERLGWLDSEGWIQREAACDFLGALPVGVLDEGLLDELLEALTVRSTGDDDQDVQAAATAAIFALNAQR